MALKKDPRGDGAIEELELLESGQSNIIDYSNKEPLLFGAGENSSHDYPGKIVVNNEPERALGVNDFTKYGTVNPSGEDAVGADTTEPTLPTGAPGLYEIDHNAHGMNFNNKIVWNDLELDEDEEEQIYEIIASDCKQCQRKSNEELILEEPKFELMEAFVEGDHPRASAGGSKGGQFVSKDGGDAGGDLSAQQQLKYKTIIQGMEVDVNLRQKKLWEKHTSMDQRNDPDFNTTYSDDLKAQGNPREPTATPEPEPAAAPPAAEPEPEEKPQGPGENWEDKINRDIYKDMPGDASATAKDRLFPYQDRQKAFAATEELNGKYSKLSDEIHSKNWYKEDYEDRLDKMVNQGNPEELPEANIGIFEHNIKANEDAIAKLEAERTEIGDKLISKGKMEYKEVQDLLRSKQTYVDDLKRRKEGSAAYWKNIGQISAHDRAVDQYRTGKKEGHFPGAEHEQMLAKRREENRRDNEERDKIRNEKRDAAAAKMKTQNDEAHARLTAAGLDINKDTGKFNTNPTDEQYATPAKIAPDSSLSEHKSWLKNSKQVLQNQKDMMQIRINNDKKSGYVSNYEEAELKEMTWRNSHFVEDHKMIGVLAFNDGDKSTFAEYQKRYQDSTNLAKSQVKEIKLYKTGGPRKGGRRAGFVTMGSWDNKGGVSLFFNSKSARAKMAEMGVAKEDWLTTSDHEFGHADWHALEPKNQYAIGQKFNDVQASKNSFIADVNDAYDNPDFKLHSYTDTYRNDRKEDLLANEAHSKMREFEIDGSMKRRVKFAEDTRNAAMEFGAPTTTLGKEQLVSANGFLTIFDSYQDLRGEMKKL